LITIIAVCSRGFGGQSVVHRNYASSNGFLLRGLQVRILLGSPNTFAYSIRVSCTFGFVVCAILVWQALRVDTKEINTLQSATICTTQHGRNTEILEMFSISAAGSTRRPVIVIGPWALKFARNERGRASNLYEARLYRTTTDKRRSVLCPVVWVSPRGWLQVARSALPLRDMMTLDEYLAVAEEWDQTPGEDACPFEPKACDWGWYKGRRVALDYSTPAWD